jgi:3-dehydroquinate dehydratase-1
MEFESFVLAAVTADLAEESMARGAADALEFRLDLADDPLDQLAAYDGELPLIATNRVESEGGGAPVGSARLDALVSALECTAVEAVDVELAAVQDGAGAGVVDAARAHNAAVVVSAHDFEGTPAPDTMESTLRTAATAGDVGKLAVTASAPGDVLDLLGLTWRLTDAGLPIATMAMGEAGRHSRAVAPVYGSRLGYAPVDPAGSTAPGQYDLETLRTLVDELGAR